MLIAEAHVQYGGDDWIGYDHRLRQIAATKSHVTWAPIDITLCNLAFLAKARLLCFKYCFSITHTLVECEWAPDQESTPSGTLSSSKHHLNQYCPTLPHLDDVEYAPCTTVSQLLAVHSLTANLNILALFVLMIHMPLISATRV